MNKIILDSANGQIKNIVLDNGDLSKTTANLKAEMKTIEGKMKLLLEVNINDKFNIIFE